MEVTPTPTAELLQDMDECFRDMGTLLKSRTPIAVQATLFKVVRRAVEEWITFLEDPESNRTKAESRGVQLSLEFRVDWDWTRNRAAYVEEALGGEGKTWTRASLEEQSVWVPAMAILSRGRASYLPEPSGIVACFFAGESLVKAPTWPKVGVRRIPYVELGEGHVRLWPWETAEPGMKMDFNFDQSVSVLADFADNRIDRTPEAEVFDSKLRETVETTPPVHLAIIFGPEKRIPVKINFQFHGLTVSEKTRSATFEVWSGLEFDPPDEVERWSAYHSEAFVDSVDWILSAAESHLRAEVEKPVSGVALMSAGSVTFRGEAELTVLPEAIPAAAPEVPEPMESRLLPVTWVSGPGKTSESADITLQSLSKMIPNPRKARRLEDEVENRLRELQEERERTGTRPGGLTTRGGLSKDEIQSLRRKLGRYQHGFTEAGERGVRRLVKIHETGTKNDPLEVAWVGQAAPLSVLREANLKEADRLLSKEQEKTEAKLKRLREDFKGALLPPEDEILELERQRDGIIKNRNYVTAWKRAGAILWDLQRQAARQMRNPFEVDAETLCQWMWPDLAKSRDWPDHWLQDIRHILEDLGTFTVAYGTKTVGGGEPLVSFRYVAGDGEMGEDFRGRRAPLIFTVRLNPLLIGDAFQLLKTEGKKALPLAHHARATGEKDEDFLEADVFDVTAHTKKEEEIRKVDRLNVRPEVHLPTFLRALGHGHLETLVADLLSSYITPSAATVRKIGGREWVKRARRGSGERERAYTSAFCPIIPEGMEFHGALGSMRRHAEAGWSFTARPNPARRQEGGLLHKMGLELPSGPQEARKRETMLLGLHALRRAVLEIGEGLLAGHVPEKGWVNLGTLADGPAIDALSNAGTRVFPFFQPGWIDRVRDAYQTKTGLSLTQDAATADRLRMERLRGKDALPSAGTFNPTAENYWEGASLSERLRYEREHRGLSQGQVAAALGVSKMAVSLWERGQRKVGDEYREKVEAWIITRP